MQDAADARIADYFTGYPRQANLFAEIKRMIESIGPVQVAVMKSGISFATRYKFAWVWLPQKYDLKQPEGSLVLSFGLDRPVNHAKIKEVVNPGPQRWTHHVVVKEEADLDDTLCEWLTEAYRFSGRAGRGRSDARIHIG